MKWFSSAMLGVLVRNNLLVCLTVAEICQTFLPAAGLRRHVMSNISQTEPSRHCNITHSTHIEEMKWFSSAMLGVLAETTLLFLLGCG
jgi:hypothetical protein